MAVSSNDQHRQNPQQLNMSLGASEVGGDIFDEAEPVDAERHGSFSLAARVEDTTRYLH